MPPSERAASLLAPSLVVVAVVVGAVVFGLTRTGAPAGTGSVEALGPPSTAVVGAARSAAVLITATGCFPENMGSGAIVDGGVVTNAHVVAGATEVVVTTTDGEAHVGEIRSFDPRLDLALLDIGDPGMSALAAGAPRGGTAAVAFGRSNEGSVERMDLDVVRTINIFIGDIYGEGRYERRGLEVRGDIEPGDSGGPIVDASGDIVGVIFSASRRSVDVAYAISALELADFVATKSETPVDVGSCLRGG